MKNNKSDAPVIAIVDDETSVTSLLSALLEHEGYNCMTFNSGSAFLECFEESQIDLVLLDLMMPGTTGYDVITSIKTKVQDKYIPILIISALTDRPNRLKVLSLGIDDFLSKPIDREELWLRVKNTLQVKAYHDRLYKEKEMLKFTISQDEEDLKLSHIETIRTLVIASEYRDDETGAHVNRIGNYSRVLAERAGLAEEFVDGIYYASSLHDIGKLAIPDSILQKKGPLIQDEFDIMKKHTSYGQNILSTASHISPYLKLGAEIALSHHEYWDGSGYPKGLAAETIPLSGRIVTLCDVYDALRSERPYKPAFDHKKTMEIMVNGDGRTNPDMFDPWLFKLFVDNEQTFKAIFDSSLKSHR